MEKNFFFFFFQKRAEKPEYLKKQETMSNLVWTRGSKKDLDLKKGKLSISANEELVLK